MKVYMGNYKRYIGPYQIADMLCFWAPKVKDQYGLKRSRDWVHNFGTWLAGDDSRPSWLSRFCEWVDGKRHRKVKIQIDPWDSWNADETLAMVILPVLKQLKATGHGSGAVDDEDVPKKLRRSSAPPVEKEWHTDEYWHLRWEYVLSEMICAFEIVLESSSIMLDESTVKRRDHGLRLFGKYYMGLWD